MGKLWTEEDDDFIRQYYPDHGGAWSEWQWLLPGRTHSAIVCRAHLLGVTARQRHYAEQEQSRHPWTGTQRAKLIKLAMRMVNETGHSIRECTMELIEMGQKYIKPPRGARERESGAQSSKTDN